jgi:methionyl-tRNA synthetase
MTEKPKFYLTTPIYYANSRPHVGSAYTTIVCDVLARYKRMCGYDVAYLTGTDEHGVNIERAAEKLGITPQELVDRNQQIFRDLWKLLGITYTDFVRTTSKEHAAAVKKLVELTLEKDKERVARGELPAIYKHEYNGRYCIYDNLFVTDTPEPIDCPTCGRPAELISEENYFFRLSAYKEKLLKLYEDQPQWVQPDFRFNEVKSFVSGPLKDVSISRKTIKWGIPWPGDPEHVFYVWYDALTSYMSGIGYGGDAQSSAKFEKFWPANLHMIGKEIIRFHAVYWPAFLMAADLPLPKNIFAHGWLLFEQEKMSKSKGNVAYPEAIVKVLGNDALRYYLLREAVFGQDGNFSRDALLRNYEADLVSGLGNLTSRVLAMIESYFGGSLPRPPAGENVIGSNVSRVIAETLKLYDQYDFSNTLKEVWTFISLVDGYLVKTAPWKLAADATKRAELAAVLYSAAEAIRIISILSHPVLPAATQVVWESLGQEGKIAAQDIRKIAWGGLQEGTRVSKPQAVFPRLDYKEASERIEALENEIKNPGISAPAESPATPAAPPPTATSTGNPPAASAVDGVAKITIDDFIKVDLRVGLVKAAERIQGTDKLLKLQVDLGEETRQILAGIALAYAPEELIGRKVVVVANLAPRKMRGLESNGMLLAASVADGKPVLCTFADDIPAGAKVK